MSLEKMLHYETQGQGTAKGSIIKLQNYNLCNWKKENGMPGIYVNH